MTTTIPRQVVNARRIAGVILVLSALGTVIMLVILTARWSTQPPSVVVAPGTPPTPVFPVSVPAQPAIQPPVSPEVALQQEVDGGYREILDHFDWLKTRYPQVLLLRSDDFASFELSGYWVTVMPVTYPSGAEANSWCDYEGIDPDNCFAKLLRRTGGPDGTTVSRK